MRILALETTERIGGLAAACDGKMLGDMMLCRQQRTAQSLAPGLRRLLRTVGWEPAEVDLIAVTIGPGSFTGLRVGVATAKTLAFAVGAEVLGVDTLETIAAGAPADVQNLAVAVDAQRGDVVAGSFIRGDDGWFQMTAPAKLVEAGSWLDGLTDGTVLAGPVLHKLADRVPDRLTVLDPAYWPPKAAAVARLAAQTYAAGRRDDLWNLVPRYSRRSAAEEKWARKSGEESVSPEHS